MNGGGGASWYGMVWQGLQWLGLARDVVADVIGRQTMWVDKEALYVCTYTTHYTVQYSSIQMFNQQWGERL